MVAFSGMGTVAAQSPSHVRAELLSSSGGYAPGHPVEVAVKLSMDDGWHVYWVNPGDAGMPVSVEWVLPEGWVAGPLLHPVPIRFEAGGIAGFGYEDEVVLPCFLTPTEEDQGDVEISAKVEWLACDAAACVPGEQAATLTLQGQAGEPTQDATVIAKALGRVPEPDAGAGLKVTEADDRLALEILLPAGIDPTGCEVFPVTPAVIDPTQQISLEKSGEFWRAEVKRHAYAPDLVSELELVLAGGKLVKPLLLSWKAAE